ncbi:MAG: Hsp33 family molecular chaperone HslO [Coxiellaceae bacterium]|nr:MAG: Hsp33 family molecular chaperone HslO [Coxiellaceae bacterium]
MQDSDALQRFIFADLQIRGELVRLNTAFTAVNERHPYPSVIKDFLGQALAASVLLRANLKYTGSLTLQIEGDGPVSLIVAQCNEKLHIRGLAKWESFDPPAQFANAVGQGYLAITITPNEGERYQGLLNWATLV